MLSRSRRPQHDGNPRQADQRSDPVVEIGRFSVHEPPPEHRQNNKDAAVSGVHAAEVGETLQGLAVSSPAFSPNQDGTRGNYPVLTALVA